MSMESRSVHGEDRDVTEGVEVLAESGATRGCGDGEDLMGCNGKHKG